MLCKKRGDASRTRRSEIFGQKAARFELWIVSASRVVTSLDSTKQDLGAVAATKPWILALPSILRKNIFSG